MKYLLLSLIIFSFSALNAQNINRELIKSGPMLGYTEHREALIWIETTSQSLVELYYVAKGSKDTLLAAFTPEYKHGYYPIRMVLPNLEMGSTYEYRLEVGGKMANEGMLEFKTRHLWQHREEAPDFSFLFGSCAYINDEKYDRPGKPYGRDYGIFKSMAETESNFMIWGGDNIYLREADWSSASGIYYRNSYNRALPELQDLFMSRPHYALQDDHDYGPNNSNRSYVLKEASLEAFRDYWGNQTYGTNEAEGIFTKFSWGDVDFYLLDNRSFRSPNWVESNLPSGEPNPEKHHFGPEQLQWLKDQLLSSYASFKVIIAGGQFLNPLCEYESFYESPYERNQLMNFIKEERVRGVVFMSGDRHHTELIKLENANLPYPFYDFTCSPFTSSPPSDIGKEENNPFRLDGTLVKAQNYGKVSVSGEKYNRVMKIAVYDKDGKVIWEREINQKELK